MMRLNLRICHASIVEPSHVKMVSCVEALRPSQQFFSHIGTEPSLPG